MKSLRNLSSACVMGMAFCVTAGAMYVTVGAAAIQEDAAFAPIPLPNAGEEVPPAPEMVIDAGEVLHDRQHHIELDAAGGFTGRISTLETGGAMTSASSLGIKIVQNGQLVASTVTDEAGGFSVSGLQPGVASVIGSNEAALLLCSVSLVGPQIGAVEAEAIEVKETADIVDLSMSTVAVGHSDISAAKSLIYGNLPSTVRFGGAVSADDEAFPEGDGMTSTSLDHHQVQLTENGLLRGQVNLLDGRTGLHRDVVDLTLHFIRDGEVLGATEVQRDGQFVMAGLNPGVHSVVSTGSDGILAIGIDIAGSAAVAQNEKYKLSSIAQSLELSASPAQPGDFNTNTNWDVFDDEFVEESSPATDGGIVMDAPFAPFGAPAGGPMGMPGSGIGGGLGGGGGGIGGGGGLGALLGAAAAGAIGYAVGDDDSSSPNR